MKSQPQRVVAEGSQVTRPFLDAERDTVSKNNEGIKKPKQRKQREGFQTTVLGKWAGEDRDWKAHICQLLRQLAPDITAPYRVPLTLF